MSDTGSGSAEVAVRLPGDLAPCTKNFTLMGCMPWPVVDTRFVVKTTVNDDDGDDNRRLSQACLLVASPYHEWTLAGGLSLELPFGQAPEPGGRRASIRTQLQVDRRLLVPLPISSNCLSTKGSAGHRLTGPPLSGRRKRCRVRWQTRVSRSCRCAATGRSDGGSAYHDASRWPGRRPRRRR